MKSFITKAVLICIIGLMGMASSYAVQCKVHNARGQVWFGSAPSRGGAIDNAMAFCGRNSVNPRNCVLDWCQGGGPIGGQWHCNAGNARGQSFVGLAPTRGQAIANVMGFCGVRSANPNNCVLRDCYFR